MAAMGSGGYGRFVLEDSLRLSERSGASCALASVRGYLMLGWTGTDSRLNTMVSSDGWHFGNKQTYDHRSSRTESSGNNHTHTIQMAPAFVSNPDGLYLAWTGTDRRVNVWNLDGGPGTHTILQERSSRAPILSATEDDVVLAWTGTDRQLNMTYGRYRTFGQPVQIGPATSSHSPAVAVTDQGAVVLAWTGTDRHLNVSTAGDLGRPGPGSFGPPLILEETSPADPTLYGVGPELVLGWRGSDRHINVMVLVRDRPPGPPTILEATSPYSPAFALHQGQLVMAWTGSDRHINLARLGSTTTPPNPSGAAVQDWTPFQR